MSRDQLTNIRHFAKADVVLFDSSTHELFIDYFNNFSKFNAKL